MIAEVELGGVKLTVPRLDHGAYPDDVLDVATALYVAIENRGAVEIMISPEDFFLGPAGGMSHNPVPPERLSVLASMGDRSGSARAAGAAPLLMAGPVVLVGARGGGFVPPPRGHGGFAGPRFYGGGLGPRYYSGPRTFFYGGPFYGGPYGYGGFYDPFWGWYGGPFGAYWWWAPRYYARSRHEAIQWGLPQGKLPPGGRTAGFLYFPRSASPEVGQVMLRWQVREAQGRTIIAELRVPMEISSD